MTPEEIMQQQAQRQSDLLRLIESVKPASVQGQELEHISAAAHNAFLATAQQQGLSLAPAFSTSYDFLNEGNKSYYRALVNALVIFLLRDPVGTARQTAEAHKQQVDAVALAELLPAELHQAALTWYGQNRIQPPPVLAMPYFQLDERLKESYRAIAEAMLRELERRGQDSSIWGDPWG